MFSKIIRLSFKLVINLLQRVLPIKLNSCSNRLTKVYKGELPLVFRLQKKGRGRFRSIDQIFPSSGKPACEHQSLSILNGLITD
jgi:hypothetical protein